MKNKADAALDSFISSYSGMFGKFTKDADSDEGAASASSPDGDYASVVRIEVSDDAAGDFVNRKAFIESQRERLVPMGELAFFKHDSGFEDSFGGILNFDLRGIVGGFFFYAARVCDIVVSIQAYSTTGKGHISDSERNLIIDAVCKAIG